MNKKSIISLLLIISITFSLINCKKKKDNPSPPILATLSTDTLIGLSLTSTLAGGKILSDGGAEITSRGVCWNQNPNPTITDYKSSEGNGVGKFKITITGLIPYTKYYIRAYAINKVGISYGPELTFVSGTVTDIDGNVYKMVTIGSQTWMTENLSTTRYRNGDPIPLGGGNSEWSNLTTGAWNYSNNSSANLIPYGRNYNWYAVNDSRNICPIGWHIPSDAEWNILMTSLGGMVEAGGKMKEMGTSHWQDPNSYATNSSSFNGVGAGFRSPDGTFMHFKMSNYFWSSTMQNESNATGWYLYYTYGDVKNGSYSKKQGFSVRCIKD